MLGQNRKDGLGGSNWVESGILGHGTVSFVASFKTCWTIPPAQNCHGRYLNGLCALTVVSRKHSRQRKDAWP
jgi:hypothetical protein